MCQWTIDQTLLDPPFTWAALHFLEVEDKLRAKNSLSLSVGLAYIKNKCNTMMIYWHCCCKYCYKFIIYKMLSYRRKTAQQGALVLAKCGRLELGDNFYGHYRSIFNHIIGLQSHRIRWQKTQNKCYYTVQGHSRSSRSLPIKSPYAISY